MKPFSFFRLFFLVKTYLNTTFFLQFFSNFTASFLPITFLLQNRTNWEFKKTLNLFSKGKFCYLSVQPFEVKIFLFSIKYREPLSFVLFFHKSTWSLFYLLLFSNIKSFLQLLNRIEYLDCMWIFRFYSDSPWTDFLFLLIIPGFFFLFFLLP